MTKTQWIMLIWFVGWLGSSVAYIVSAFAKAKHTSTEWHKIIYWPSILLFIPTWPVVVTVYAYFVVRMAMRLSVPDLEKNSLSRRRF